MYISQPTGNIKFAYHSCDETKLDTWLDDGASAQPLRGLAQLV
jgi:hypothetical protein